MAPLLPSSMVPCRVCYTGVIPSRDNQVILIAIPLMVQAVPCPRMKEEKPLGAHVRRVVALSRIYRGMVDRCWLTIQPAPRLHRNLCCIGNPSSALIFGMRLLGLVLGPRLCFFTTICSAWQSGPSISFLEALAAKSVTRAFAATARQQLLPF
jgi:hypothetical protein